MMVTILFVKAGSDIEVTLYKFILQEAAGIASVISNSYTVLLREI